ncbi:hypothetical protein SDRG_17106 [Saprolegnia diclina VS20]|uniref:VLIG-type G domain-containing protein n=1 Tax=Saprolegnia diclina (strain VS20) TaxID=1156394 RepID=T0PVH4_SAPDV|nr:hypothetical protein SDRG_17106 [Saprolegnia diclina VS20]EQC25005.1 hypothetical protein SDRG_17106 [Saprolegnia diclina VS20]|eukprot:XP_008621563.1 hypothetical protein SDRG_17106 [Saprolegnia diclina VS20]
MGTSTNQSQANDKASRLASALLTTAEALHEVQGALRIEPDDKVLVVAQRFNTALEELCLTQWTIDKRKLRDKNTLLTRLPVLDDVLAQAHREVSATVANLTDDEVVARASGGVMLSGHPLGYSSHSTSMQKVLLSPPTPCVLTTTPSTPVLLSHWFESATTANAFRQRIQAHGWSSAETPAPLPTAGDVTRLVYVASAYVPTATLTMEIDAMRLSSDAECDAQSIIDAASAQAFLMAYGSHVHGGRFELGGIFWKTTSLSVDAAMPVDVLRQVLSEAELRDLSLAYSDFTYGAGVDVYTALASEHKMCDITTQLEYTGPMAPSADTFAERLAADKTTWRVVDRPASLIGVWVLLRATGHALAADLVRTAWLELVVPGTTLVLEAAVHAARLDQWLHDPTFGSATKNIALPTTSFAMRVVQAQEHVATTDDPDGAMLLDLVLLLLRCEIELGMSLVGDRLQAPSLITALRRFVTVHDIATVARLGALFDAVLDARLASASVVLDATVREPLRRAVALATLRDVSVTSPGTVWRSPTLHMADVPAAGRLLLDTFQATALPDMQLLTRRLGAMLFHNGVETRAPQLWTIAVSYGCQKDGFVAPLSLECVRTMLAAMQSALDKRMAIATDSSDDDIPVDRFASVDGGEHDERVLGGRPMQEFLTVTQRPTAATPPTDRLWFALKHRLNVAPALYLCEATGKRLTRRTRVANGPIGMDELLSLLASRTPVARADVYRHLLDRRFLVPCVYPSVDNDMLFLDAIGLELVETRLERGVTSSLLRNTAALRVAIVSERPAKASATRYWIQNVFHVNSVQCLDRGRGRVTERDGLVELGWGFVHDATDAATAVVLHVVGDYKPWMPLLAAFADVLLIDAGPGAVRATPLAHGVALHWRHVDDDDEQLVHDEATATVTLACPMSATYAVLTDYLLHEPWPTSRIPIAMLPLPLHVGCLSSLAPTEAIDAVAATDFGTLRTHTLQLQRSFVEEVALRVALQREASVPEQQRLRQQIADHFELHKPMAHRARHLPLLRYFVSVLEQPSAASRELRLVDLDRRLARSCDGLSTSAEKRYRDAAVARSNDPENQDSRAAYADALQHWSLMVTGLEHLWRELSHVFAAAPNALPDLAALAAQHLMDGFALELMDGDAGNVNTMWIRAVLQRLETALPPRSRVFVLSVLGVQSSGKSTLLNGMFGVRLKTSVARCTRGVNLQLLACADDYRDLFDYILLLDTEGIQSPEYVGVDGTPWRDNRMASMAILPADATIVLTKGEATKTMNDMLPVVLSVLANSALAAASGGRLATQLYFAFNQMDVTMTSSMHSSLDALLDSLRASAKQVAVVRQSSATASFLDTFCADTDVVFLGLNSGMSDPPGDTPIADYGERLVQLRDHIFAQAAPARTFGALNETLRLVWTCLESANFELDFASAHERMVYDRLVRCMTRHTQALASIYTASFETVLQRMSADNATTPHASHLNHRYEALLEQSVAYDVRALDSVVAKTLADKAFAKWATAMTESWADQKRRQAAHSTRLVVATAEQLFQYEAYAKAYKTELQDALVAHLATEGAEATLAAFDATFDAVVCRAAAKHPPLAPDVPRLVCTALHNNHVLTPDELALISKPNDETKIKTGWRRYIDRWFTAKEQRKAQMMDAVRDCVLRCIADTDRYGDEVVLNCVLEGMAMLHSLQLPPDDRLTGLRMLVSMLTTQLQDRQARWDAVNCIAVKFGACKQEMCQFATNLCRGQRAATFEEEVVGVVAAALKHAYWVQSADAMQAALDHSLLMLLRQHEVPEVLRLLKEPTEHATNVTTNLIRAQVQKSYLTVAAKLVAAVKEGILAAAASAENAVESRSTAFLQELCLVLQRRLKCSGTSVLVTSLPSGKATVFDCDAHGPSLFSVHNDGRSPLNVPQSLLARLEELSCTLSPSTVWSSMMATRTLDLIRNEAYGAVDGIVPRCGQPCPWCKCPCTKALGHASTGNADDLLHDTPHQPDGLVGVLVQDCGMRHDDGSSHRFRDFETVYPGWALPRVTQRLPLREYIFAHCHDELVAWHNVRKCEKIPASYFAHDLCDIERTLERLMQ